MAECPTTNQQVHNLLVGAYTQWLQDGFHVVVDGRVCKLISPFLDRHNDHIEIYATRHNRMITLSDDGYTLSEMTALGIHSDAKQDLILSELRSVLGRVPVDIRVAGSQITIETAQENIGPGIHAMIQVMMVIPPLLSLKARI